MTIMEKLNSGTMYLIVGVIIAFIAVVCVIFMVRAFRAGKKMGIDPVKMKRAVSASATFAILPSVGILLGVIALSGSLGIPLPWFRLSVIGALHYETQVAEAAAEQVGITLSASQMNEQAFTTIALLMGFCICWSMVFSAIFTKKYSKKLISDSAAEAAQQSDTAPEAAEQPAKKKKFSLAAFGDTAMTALFIGLVSAYIGSYAADFTSDGNWLPLAVAAVGAAAMALFTLLKEKKHAEWVDSFSVAGSMILAMASAVLFGQFI